MAKRQMTGSKRSKQNSAGGTKPKHEASEQLGDRPTLRVACTFCGVSFPGGPTCSIGVKFASERDGGGEAPKMLSDVALRAFLLESRIDITMIQGDDEDLLITDAQLKMNGTADFHTASMKRDSISGKLTFDAESVDVELLTKFAKKAGTIIVARQGDAGEEQAGAGAVGGEDDPDQQRLGDE